MRNNGNDPENIPLKNGSYGNIDDNLLENPFEEDFNDPEFWKKVSELSGPLSNGDEQRNAGKSWNEALLEVRLERLQAQHKDEDLLVYLITTAHDNFVSRLERLEERFNVMPSFLQQLSAFAEALISADDLSEKRYGRPLDVQDDASGRTERKSILHLAAERNLLEVAKMIVRRYPNLLYVPSSVVGDEVKRRGRSRDWLPVQFAIEGCHDDMAQLLIDPATALSGTGTMKNIVTGGKERIRMLFESTKAKPAAIKFSTLVNNPDMKKTVLAVLDCCINPDWPYIPRDPKDKEEEEETEERWSKLPSISPMRYHFYYRILDGDQKGNPPSWSNLEGNPPCERFSHRQVSCLQLLTRGEHGEFAMKHPVVRHLVNRKWNDFCQTKAMRVFGLYAVFLLLLSLSLFLDKPSTGAWSYERPLDKLRGFCEISVLLLTCLYIIWEVVEVIQEPREYWCDPWNYVDLLCFWGIIALVPLRLHGNTTTEMTVAACTFLGNFMRVFKYFPIIEPLGVYLKTFAQLIKYDFSKFLVVYGVTMLAFAGSVFLALQATNTVPEFGGGFKEILLQEVRAFTEGKEFADDYKSYNGGVVALLMLNMLVVMVIMSNILIGQVSQRYTLANDSAKIQYDIDKLRIISKMENSFFRALSDRVKHYREGDYVGEGVNVRTLLDDWDELKKSAVLTSPIPPARSSNVLLKCNQCTCA